MFFGWNENKKHSWKVNLIIEEIKPTYGQTKTTWKIAVILQIVLPLLPKALYEFSFFEGILQEFAKQSAE